jgi:hypothetical protein
MVDCGGLFGNRGEPCFFYKAFAYSKLWGFKQAVRAVDFGRANTFIRSEGFEYLGGFTKIGLVDQTYGKVQRQRKPGLFFVFFGKPVLEVFGEYLDIFFLHYVGDNSLGDFQIEHGLVRPLPESVAPRIGIGQVQLGNQLSELSEHYRIEVVVIS